MPSHLWSHYVHIYSDFRDCLLQRIAAYICGLSDPLAYWLISRIARPSFGVRVDPQLPQPGGQSLGTLVLLLSALKLLLGALALLLTLLH